MKLRPEIKGKKRRRLTSRGSSGSCAMSLHHLIAAVLLLNFDANFAVMRAFSCRQHGAFARIPPP
eukprot:10022662-Heterocapsa_arctica.AAC.1